MREIEVKVMNVDVKELREKLKKLGAKNIEPERLMNRAIFDVANPEDKPEWIRLRDEGDKVTLAYKFEESRSIDGMKEHEVVVSDFDESFQLLESAGLQQKSVQQTKRETWKLNEVTVEIDTWPHIPQLVELEAESEDDIANAVRELGLDSHDKLHGSADSAYEYYFDIGHGSEITCLPKLDFSTKLPDEIEKLRKPM